MLSQVGPRKQRTLRELLDLDIEIRFVEGVIRRDPGYVEAWQILEADYAVLGDVENSLRVEEHLVRLRPHDPVVLYNLACAYSLTRQLRRAADTLNRAIDHGYNNFKLLIRDPDLMNLRKHSVFRRVQARILARKIVGF